jgi:DNA primase large subunit
MNKIPPTFYETSNINSIKIDILNEIILQRYNILSKIFEIFEKNKNVKENFSQIFSQIQIDAQKFSWNDPNKLELDIASHFILSLYFCRHDSDNFWFCQQESRLFQLKVNYFKYDMFETLKTLGIPLKEVDNNIKNNLNDKIYFNSINNINEKIFFVPFEHALTLVPTKKYFLFKGDIYIPQSEIQNLLFIVFQQKLQNKLTKIQKHFDDIIQDNRISNILKHFESEREKNSIEEETIPNDQKLHRMEDVEKYYKKSFPLCMTMIQNHINENSHLMHFGRLQYTLFLKGAGLPVEETLKFFKKKFEKKTPSDKFEKQYAYNIRHSYGLEGKRSDYAPYSCTKIFNMNSPNSQECHGCPFKNYSVEKLKPILFGLGLNEENVLTILNKKKNNEFPLCCIKYFEAVFPGEEYEKVGFHPNKYFNSAMKILSKRNSNKIQYEKNKDVEIKQN